MNIFDFHDAILALTPPGTEISTSGDSFLIITPGVDAPNRDAIDAKMEDISQQREQCATLLSSLASAIASLPPGVVAQFSPIQDAVKNALLRRDIALAKSIIATASLAAELEPSRSNLLTLFPS